MGAGQHARKLHGRDLLFQGGQHGIDFIKGCLILPFFPHFDQYRRVFQLLFNSKAVFDNLLQPGAFTLQLLSLLSLIPEIGTDDLRF